MPLVPLHHTANWGYAVSNGGPVVLCFGVVDEADIVRDFIEYHAGLGIERFVATDAGSTNGTLDVLGEYERSGRLHLTR